MPYDKKGMKYKDSMLKDSMNLTKTGVALGVGASAVHQVGGNTAGLSALSSSMPVMGTAIGAGHALKLVKKLM